VLEVSSLVSFKCHVSFTYLTCAACISRHLKSEAKIGRAIQPSDLPVSSYLSYFVKLRVRL
jgi:hypothetical protein